MSPRRVYSMTMTAQDLSSPTETLWWNEHTGTTSSTVVCLVPPPHTNSTAAPIEWTPPRVERRFDKERAPKQHRHRLEGARHGFSQAARLPCYRGARTR